jgi:hypothetical protein
MCGKVLTRMTSPSGDDFKAEANCPSDMPWAEMSLQCEWKVRATKSTSNTREVDQQSSATRKFDRSGWPASTDIAATPISADPPCEFRT